MHDVYKYWNNNHKTYNKLKYFFLSVGCNDLVHHTPHQLFTNIHRLVDKLKESFPGIKMILSEVTPRMDSIDKRVEEVNVLLTQYIEGKNDLFLTRNSNLRNRDFFTADGVHLNHTITPRFANNIKRALRAAYGIQRPARNVNDHSKPSITRNEFASPKQSTDQQSLVQSIRNELLLRIMRAFQYSGT